MPSRGTVLDRIIQAPVTVIERSEGMPPEFTYERRNVTSRRPGLNGEWRLVPPLTFSATVGQIAQATVIEMDAHALNGDALPAVDALPFPFTLTVTWADGRAVAWTVTAAERERNIDSDSFFHKYNVRPGSVTGDPSTAPAMGDVVFTVGQGQIVDVERTVMRDLWARRRDVLASDETIEDVGRDFAKDLAVFRIRFDARYTPTIQAYITDDDGQQRRIVSLAQVGRRRYWDMTCERFGP